MRGARCAVRGCGCGAQVRGHCAGAGARVRVRGCGARVVRERANFWLVCVLRTLRFAARVRRAGARVWCLGCSCVGVPWAPAGACCENPALAGVPNLVRGRSVVGGVH